MKTRNYMSLEFHNNYSSPKLNLRPLNKCFLPEKTFSNGYNYNNKILNLKTSFINTFSKTNNVENKNNYLIISKDKNNISNRNTYYKTINFSPESTKSVYSSKKSVIKQKYKGKKMNKHKNSPISLKKIEFIDDDETEYNWNNKINKGNNIRYIFIRNKKKLKNIKQKQEIFKSDIEISGKNLIKNNYISESNNKIKTNNINSLKKNNEKLEIDFIYYPNIKTMKLSKSKNMEMDIKKNEGFNSPKIIKDNKWKSLEEYNNKIFSEKTNSNNKPEVKSKKIKNIEKKEIGNKSINDNKFINILSKTNNKNNKINKLNYELDADIDKFDPITFEPNKKLNKLFLQNKEKQKLFLEKLLENDKIKELILKFEGEINKEEIKNQEDNKIKSIKIENNIKRKTRIKSYLKDFSINKINALLKFFNKPSEYINYIADEIYNNIDSFRKKEYNSIEDDHTDDNILFYENDEKSKNKNKDKFYFSNFFSRRGSTLKNIFRPQVQLNIKNKNFLKTSNSNIIISNNFIKTEEKNNDNIKISQDQKSFYNKSTQTKNFANEPDNQNNNIISDIINYQKIFGINILDNNIGIKGKRKKDKKTKTFFNLNNYDKDKREEIKNLEDIQKEDIDGLNNKEMNIEEIEEIEEEKKEFEHFPRAIFDKQKSKTLIKKSNKKRINLSKKKSHRIKNKNKEEYKDISDETEKNEKIISFDEFYDFKNYRMENEFLIIDEIDKIKMKVDLKVKLIENMKQVLILIKKEKKTKHDYIKLHHCQKRINYIIKKLTEIDIKKNIFKNPLKDLSFPDSLEDRKALYRLMRTVEIQIKEELKKYDEIVESDSSSEKENSNIQHIYEILPIEDEEEKTSIKVSKEKPEKQLIYDNLYLYKDDEDDNKNIEIKKEVYDILNKEENSENENNSKENEERPKSPLFLIKRRQFRRTRRQHKKSLDSENEKGEEKKINNLDNKMNNFFEKIKKLKEENIGELDYDKILKELIINKGNNYDYIEENMEKELRIINFFKYFQNSRKMNLAGKKFFRNRYKFNSPIKFIKSKD